MVTKQQGFSIVGTFSTHKNRTTAQISLFVDGFISSSILKNICDERKLYVITTKVQCILEVKFLV